jgi:hypothetical protein
VLTRDPDVLVIAVVLRQIARLSENEAPVVVARGVNQMAEDLSRAPAAARLRPRRPCFIDPLEQLQRVADRFVQARRRLC